MPTPTTRFLSPALPIPLGISLPHGPITLEPLSSFSFPLYHLSHALSFSPASTGPLSELERQMVSSLNFRPDSWLSQAFARDTRTLTSPLYNSLAGSISPSPDLVIPESGVSACSEPEAALECPRNSGPFGGVSKRKSRPSKRTQTTFITVDHANFQQMVQQVTGVRLGNLEATVAPIPKAEPERQSRPLRGGGCLPTLDTSAFLLEHNQAQKQMTGDSGPLRGMSDAGSAALYFDTFCSFPTLESWNVM